MFCRFRLYIPHPAGHTSGGGMRMEKREIEMPRPKKDEDDKKLSPVTPIVAGSSVVLQHQSESGVPSDVNGSYTGTPIDGGQPTQDADDL